MESSVTRSSESGTIDHELALRTLAILGVYARKNQMAIFSVSIEIAEKNLRRELALSAEAIEAISPGPRCGLKTGSDSTLFIPLDGWEKSWQRLSPKEKQQIPVLFSRRCYL